MNGRTTVIYNGSCPICSREIALYKRESEEAGRPLDFRDLAEADLARVGLTPDAAARRFHVVRDGRLLDGLEAFLALWSELPRWRWLARLLALPGLRTLSAFGYDRIAAPLLYALHRRRQRRA